MEIFERRGAVEFRRCARHYVDVCQAISFAHDNGVPAPRCQTQQRDDRQIRRKPLVVDWGLARVSMAKRKVVPSTGNAVSQQRFQSRETAMGRPSERLQSTS